MEKFDDITTKIDIFAEARARRLHREHETLQRQIAHHLAAWELQELQASWRTPTPVYSEDFSDEPPTKEIRR